MAIAAATAPELPATRVPGSAPEGPSFGFKYVGEAIDAAGMGTEGNGKIAGEEERREEFGLNGSPSGWDDDVDFGGVDGAAVENDGEGLLCGFGGGVGDGVGELEGNLDVVVVVEADPDEVVETEINDEICVVEVVDHNVVTALPVSNGDATEVDELAVDAPLCPRCDNDAIGIGIRLVGKGSVVNERIPVEAVVVVVVVVVVFVDMGVPRSGLT
ncbi:hypothetical protein HK101_004823 [Irineochytrium annulatum]|nr:hypothetical protein HK101_004823 [Irineochytrium annulatum]